MRTWKAILTAAVLASLSAAAQQAADSQPSAQPPAPDTTQTAQPSQQGTPSTATQSAAAPAPTTMDQVVNLFIEREHALIQILSKRTPVVETYLQNLAADPQLGPVPSADHYFLGRMDMGKTGGPKNLRKEKTKKMEAALVGGFQKPLKGKK